MIRLKNSLSKLKVGEHPRIILIGGPIGVGKSTLAVELAHKLKIYNVVHTDTLRNTLRVVTRDKSAVHLSSYRCWKTYSSKFTKGDLVRAFYNQCDLIAPMVESIIREAKDFGKSTIIEGVHILPYHCGRQFKVMIDIEDSVEHMRRFKVRAKTTYTRRSLRYYQPYKEQLRVIRNLMHDQFEYCNLPIIQSNTRTLRTLMEVIR